MYVTGYLLINSLKSSGKYIYHWFFTVSNPIFCVYGFGTILSVNRDYFPKHH
jgi:hypothetical protein